MTAAGRATASVAVLLLAGCLSEGSDPIAPVATGLEKTKVIENLTPQEHTELCLAAGAARVSVESTDAHCWAFAFEATVVEASPRQWTDQEARDSCHRAYQACKAEPVRPVADLCEFSPSDVWTCRMTVGQAEACLTLAARLRNTGDRALPPCKDVTMDLLRSHHNRPPPTPNTELVACTAGDLTGCPPYVLLGL